MNYHFERTFALISYLNSKIDSKFDVVSLSTFNTDASAKYIYNYINTLHFDEFENLIKETLSIEFEKFNLKDNLAELIRIQSIERLLNWEREILLSLKFDELSNKSLVRNPLIYLYESNWNLISNGYILDEIILGNFKNLPGDFYFLFQKTGFFDDLSSTNILEYNLTKYEYIILLLAENPCSVENVILNFINFFEINSQLEYQKFLQETEQMIKIMIFNKFLIIAD